ncbi:MAG: hypothetical protein JWR34_1798 [Mycobacterium sp.]|nr:hypothetical protein [Mycobacterium sp.]
MKRSTEYLNVDAVNLYKKDGEVVLRLITPMRSYDVWLLPHHAAALAKSILETSRSF